jgi:peptide/nickel transport system substrate-binding protein
MTRYRWGRSAGVGRRRFLAGAGLAGAGAASLALVGCGDDDDADETATVATTTEPAQSSPTAEVKTGGTIYSNNGITPIDTLDPHRSRFGEVHNILAATMSRLVHYADPECTQLAGDLSDGLPEQPDELTLVFRLKPGIKWHDKPPVDGRAFEVEDVVYFVDRQKAGLDNYGVEDPTFYRRGALQVIDSVEAVDANTARFRLTQPDATLLDTLAGSWSFLVAPEAGETFTTEQWMTVSAEVIIGTGPFIVTDMSVAESARFDRNPDYYNAGIPYADGMNFLTRVSEDSGETNFRVKQTDLVNLIGGTGQAQADGIIADFPEVLQKDYALGYPILSSFATDRPPWNDNRLLQAVNRASDRVLLLNQLHQGRGRPSPAVPWPLGDWSLPEAELATLPGYLADRDADIAEARRLWEAAGGPAELTITFPDAFAVVFPDAVDVVTGQLAGALDIRVDARLVTYPELTAGLADRSLSFRFGWGNPFDPDPVTTLHRVYHSSGSENQWGVNQPGGLVVDGLDAKLERARVSYDTDERRAIVHDIQRQATEFGCLGIMNYYNYMDRVLHWPYLHGVMPSSFNFGQHQAFQWLDLDDPSFQGRP